MADSIDAGCWLKLLILRDPTKRWNRPECQEFGLSIIKRVKLRRKMKS